MIKNYFKYILVFLMFIACSNTNTNNPRTGDVYNTIEVNNIEVTFFKGQDGCMWMLAGVEYNRPLDLEHSPSCNNPQCYYFRISNKHRTNGL